MRSKATNQRLRDEVQSNRNYLLSIFGAECQICNFDVKEVLEIHHVLPLSVGGTNDYDNLAILCPTCHKIFHAHIKNNDSDMDIRLINAIGAEKYLKINRMIQKSLDKEKVLVEQEKKILDKACEKGELFSE